MNRKPRLELLTPDLNLMLPFVPGYDLLERQKASISSEELTGIALSLWELTSTPEAARTSWRESQQDLNGEGGIR